MRVTCERCLRRYDVPDATVKGRKIRARCKCGARVVVQDEERAAKSLAAGSTTGSIQRPVRWFVDITSWEPIAMDMRQLVRAFDAGRIDADTLVWRKGMPDWRRLRDISELAERLVGAGGDEGEKGTSEPPPADLSLSHSEPPPRQSERSRTPPASYTVGGRSGSEPPAAGHSSTASSSGDGVVGQGAAGAYGSSSLDASPANPLPNHVTGSKSSVPPPVSTPERASLEPSITSASAPTRDSSTRDSSTRDSSTRDSSTRDSSTRDSEANGSAPPSRRSAPNGSARPQSRRNRSKVSSRPNASPAPVLSRTVTQTGLETPAEVTARNPMSPTAASGSDVSAGRTRDSRASAAPGSARRQPSSDETPAQKPSSLSVPPGAIVEGRSRPRGRRFLALAAVLLGGAFLVMQVARRGDGVPATAEHRVDSVPEHNAEKAPVRERKAAGQPEPRTADPLNAVSGTSALPVAKGSNAAPTGSTSAAPGEALNVEASATETVGAAAPPQVAEAPKVPPRQAPIAAPVQSATPRTPAAVTTPPAAPMKPTAPATPAPPAAVPPVKTVALAATPIAPTTAPTVTPPAPLAREPRPFDEALATQQFQAAVTKAAACGQQGSTRGTGRVKVAIEPWGRVGRVSHLTQDFTGTPVGTCVMQVFQEIRVPPFDGNSRSIAGEFVIE